MYLNLDPNFAPYGTNQALPFEHFTFSGGEPHFKLLEAVNPKQTIVITHRVQSFNDMGVILLAVDALRRAGIKQIELVLPYFPAARQDRVMVAGEPLSVKIYADLINNLHLDQVTIFDAHSEVAIALLNNCRAVSNHPFIEQVLQNLGEVLLIAPDGGALKKIYKLAAHLQGAYPVVECSKSRDVRTGKLSGFKVFAEDLQGADCLIVDDICDGGGTFMGLATALKEKNAGKLYLAVSHGIFNKGIEPLTQHFSQIFTTNAFKDCAPHENLTQLNLGTFL
ncbi:MAG: ribose-phosphate diphosphokinase [Aureispira sp.]